MSLECELQQEAIAAGDKEARFGESTKGYCRADRFQFGGIDCRRVKRALLGW
jgi:hypothetical protein